jgi:hypothetical protein
LTNIIDFNARRIARDESTLSAALEKVAANDADAPGVYAGFGMDADAPLVWHEAPMPSVTPRRRHGLILSVVLDNVAAVWFTLLVHFGGGWM